MTEHFCGYWIQPVRKQTGLKTFKNDFDVQLSVFDKSFDYALGIHWHYVASISSLLHLEDSYLTRLLTLQNVCLTM